nr:glycosyltransferase family 39 protein [Lachnospiraceae bacterium]
MNKSVIKKFDYLTFAILGMLSFLITCASPTLVKASEFEDPDSSAFRYMGMLIAKGGIPYRDAFDNKGPLMYFIQYIGYILSKDYGVYIMEFIFVLSFLIVSYTISKRFMNSRLSLLSVILSSAPLGLFFMGNMTEEYSMFFLSTGLLIYIDYFLFGKQSSVRIIICGFCFGAVLFIRANMA